MMASSAFGASLTITSTTSVTAETVNNTSTSNSFIGTSNGNPAPRGISKIPLRELLYPGATTKIYVHVQPWWELKPEVLEIVAENPDEQVET